MIAIYQEYRQNLMTLNENSDLTLNDLFDALTETEKNR